MRIGEFAFNKELEVEGRWVEEIEGLRLKIARLNNPPYKAYIRKNGRRISKANGRMDFDAADEIAKKAFSKFILLGWENLQDDEGNDIPYSSEKALELMTEYDEFYSMITEHASNAEAYKQNEMESDSGNS